MPAAKIVSGMMTKERHSIFRSAVALFFGALALGSVVFTQESRAQSARSDTTARSGDRSKLVGQLDGLVRGAIERDGIPGLSVVVVQGRDTLLSAGYGYADLSHRVPTTPDTRYRVQSLGGLFGVVLLQQVEAGRITLDDDASILLPDFPWQGHHVTVRQLLDATSGLPDYHYLGDAVEANAADPKTLEDVIALFAGRSFTHSPGERYEWTISGWILAGALLERLTGESFDTYVTRRVYAPAGMRNTTNCDDSSVIPDLARGYHRKESGFIQHTTPSASLYPFLATVCGTARDAVNFAHALRDGRLLREESWRAMTTPTSAEQLNDPFVDDPHAAQGLGVRLRHEGSHAWVGDSGSLLGYSGALLDFPAESLTISVLSNSGGRSTYELARRLARAVFGLPPLPETQSTTLHDATARAMLPALLDLPVTAAERTRLVGIYRLRFQSGPPQFAGYERTIEIADRLGHLMLRYLGEPQEPLLAQGKGEFAVASAPERRFTFESEGGQPIRVLVRYGDAPEAWRLSGAKLQRQEAVPSASAADALLEGQVTGELGVRAVLATDEERRLAILHGDVDALDRSWADDATIFWGDGTADDKASALALFRSNRLRYEQLEYEKTCVRLYHDTAVVTGQARVKLQDEKGESSTLVWVTRVYVYGQGGWRMVASQSTRTVPTTSPRTD